jgi:hypothetical protein
MEEEKAKAEQEGRTITAIQIRILDRQQAMDAGIAEPNRQVPITLMDAPTDVDQVRLCLSLKLSDKSILFRLLKSSFNTMELRCHRHRRRSPSSRDVLAALRRCNIGIRRCSQCAFLCWHSMEPKAGSRAF